MEPYQAMELRNEQMVTSGDGGAGLDVKREDPERESPQISVKKEDEDVHQIVVKIEEEEPIVVEQDKQQTVVKDEEGRLIVEEVLEERGQHIAVKKEEDDEQQIAVKEEEEQSIVVEDDEEDRQQIVVKEEDGQDIVVKDVGQLIAVDEEEGQQILVQEEETDHHKWIHIVVKEEERQPIVIEEEEVERQPLQPATMELQSEAGYCDPTNQMQTSDREQVDEAMAASDCSSATVVKEGTEESQQLQTKACLHYQANNFPSTQPPQQTCDSVAGRDQIIQGEGRKTCVSTTIRHQIAEGGVTQTSDHSAGKYQIHDSASERHPITGRKVSRTLAETRLLQTETCVVRDHVYQNTRKATAKRSTSKVRVTRTVDSTPGRSQITHAGGNTRTVDSTPVFQTSLSPSLPEADTCLSEEEQTSDEEVTIEVREQEVENEPFLREQDNMHTNKFDNKTHTDQMEANDTSGQFDKETHSTEAVSAFLVEAAEEPQQMQAGACFLDLTDQMEASDTDQFDKETHTVEALFAFGEKAGEGERRQLQSEACHRDVTDKMKTSDREQVDEAMAASDCASATVVKEGTEESQQLQIKACLHDQTNHHLGVPSPPQQIRDSASKRHPITGRKVSRTLAETRLLQIRTCVMRDHAYQRITPITPCCTGSGNKKKKKTPCCRRDASPRNPCPLCSVVFQHQSALREHLKTHTVAGGKYPCKLCGAVFGVISRLKDHQHTHTGETPYLCETCGKTFKTGEKLQHHRSSHSGFKTYLCQLCGLRFFRPQQLSQHMRKHSSVRDVCGDVLSSPFLLETHMKTRNHCDFLCHVCGKAFRFYKALSTHLRYHELTVKLTDSRNNRHSCRVCGEKFVHFAELLSHKRFSHVEDKPHKCDVCGAAYTSMRSLNKHEKAKKHKIDRFQCLVCGETFSRLRALYSHKQVSHFDKKSYKCSLCEASYLHPRSLRKHKKKQHPNNTCPPVEHEIRPARLPEKPYKCTLCDHAFVLEDHLRRHLLRHSNRPRRFVCEKCGVSYIRKACFLKHMRIHNPIGSQAD